MQISQGQNLDVPVMSNLISLTVNAEYKHIQDFFDEEHFPKLNNLSLKDQYCGLADLSTHLDLWKQHRGVQSLALTTRCNYRIMSECGEKVVQLFPAVKKLDLTLIAYGNFVNDVMTPLNLWDLEETKLVLWQACLASTVVGVLRDMAIWKGIKIWRELI